MNENNVTKVIFAHRCRQSNSD